MNDINLNISKILLEKVKNVAMSINENSENLFVDVGSNLGQGFNFFKQYFITKNYDYLLIEPNPYCH